MSGYSIMAAFNNSLSSFAASQGVSVAYENVSFTPPNDTPYLRSHLLPSETVASALGTSAYNRHRGYFQVDAVYPINDGWGACATMAEAIRKQFKRGTTLAGNITVERSYVLPGLRDEGRYVIPVVIHYRADISNG